MKKILPLLYLLPACFLFTARAEVPADTTPASTPPPASETPPPSSPGMINYTNAPAPDDIDPAKKAEIVKLLQLTGTVKLTQQMMDQMLSNFKTHNSRVSQEFWDRFEKEMDIQALVDKIVPLYAKYYSLEDLKAVNAFYQTPAGQRMLAATPLIMHESMQIGQDWGRQVVTRLIAELKDEKAKAAAADAATNSASNPASPTNAAPVSAPAPATAPAPAPAPTPAPAASAPASTPALQ